MRRSNSKPEVSGTGNGEAIDWELRPGGMLVQKREDGSGPTGPMIKIKVAHGSNQHEVTVPAQSSFGELKRLLAQETGLEPQEQRLLFRGKEKDNDECLHMAGVKERSKVLLLEDPASKERKLEQMRRDEGIARACEAVSVVTAEVDKLAEKVDKLAEKVAALESTVNGGTKVAEKEFVVLTELLMVQLLKLDGIEAEGEAKVQRKLEVRRIQSLVETVDALKARNSSPFSSSGSGNNATSVTTQWETFESGLGSLNAPPLMPPSTKVTEDWEQFD